MVRTQSRNANGNANQRPVIERAPKVAAAPELITMAGVQAMIQMMLDHQMEEKCIILQHNRDEHTVPVEHHEPNEG